MHRTGPGARADRRRAGAWQAYEHCATGRTWAMAWAGTVMTPLAVRTLTAPAGPLASGPQQAWPLVAVTATAAALALAVALAAGRWPPARERGDHRQDQSRNGEPDASAQPGGGASGGHSARAVSGVTDRVSDPPDSEDRHARGRQRGDGQPLDRARGRAAGSAQDSADADETQHGHLDGMPAASGSGKLVQPVRGRGGRAGSTSFTWLHIPHPPRPRQSALSLAAR
jgi:hypothetical protein